MTDVEKIYSSITYPDVYGNTDVKYSLEEKSLKEYIVVNSRTLQTTYRFTISCPGLSAELADDRSVMFLDPDGEVKFKMPAPYMYDGAGEFSDDISVKLTEKSDGIYAYDISPDLQWMSNLNRVYPVLYMKGGLRYNSANNINREAVGLIYTPLPDSVKASTSRIIKAELWL